MSVRIDFRRKTNDAVKFIRKSLGLGGNFVERLEQRQLLTTVLEAAAQVNTFTTGDQLAPAIAMDANGDYVVVWQSKGQEDTQFTGVSGYGIYAQMYRSDGEMIGGEIAVNTYTTGNQQAPSVAMDASGNFVVVWESQNEPEDTSFGIWGQRFTSDGNPDNDPFLVNEYTTGSQRNAVVAMDNDGDFTVVWQSLGQDGDGYGVYGRQYNHLTGLPADEFRVSNVVIGTQSQPAISMEPTGDFVVSWSDYQVEGVDVAVKTKFDVYARRFSAGGTALSVPIRVNTYTPDVQQFSSVAVRAGGQFVVTWESYKQESAVDFDYGIYGQRFDGSDTPVPVGSEFHVNTYTTQAQRFPSVSIDPYGEFVIAWQSNLQDGGGQGVYAQQFDSAGAPSDVEFLVNSITTGSEALPVVASDANGGFVIAYHGPLDPAPSGLEVWKTVYAGPETHPPVVDDFQFIWQDSAQRIVITFNQDIGSFDSGALTLENLNYPDNVPQTLDVSYDSGTKSVTITFPDQPNGGALADGHYRVTIDASYISNENGQMPDNYVGNFFFMNGDANHDAVVDVGDLYALSLHWQQTSPSLTYLMGDFNYDGVVNAYDLGILSLNWAKSLPDAPAAPAPPVVISSPAVPTPVPAPTPVSTSTGPNTTVVKGGATGGVVTPTARHSRKVAARVAPQKASPPAKAAAPPSHRRR